MIACPRLQVMLGAAVALCLTASFAHAQEASLVTVDGRRIEVMRAGVGSPTIVLESGFGGSADSWQSLLPELGRVSHVIAYSRAGLGKSDPRSTPPSPKVVVEELRSLLRALEVRGPVVLVGHSLGGLFARLYVSLYGDEVSGLVLVDGTHEAQWLRWQRLSPSLNLADSLQVSLARASPSLRAEGELFAAIERAGSVEGLHPLPDLPLAVLTAVRPCAGSWSCSDSAAIRSWREGHDEWFARSTTGVHFVSTATTHDFITEEPHLLVSAVRFVVDAARKQARK